MSDAINFELSSGTKVGWKGKTFHFKKGNYVQSGTRQQNGRCLTTLEAHIVLKELHEGVDGGHFVIDITAKKFQMQDIDGQLYSKILVTFAKVVIVVKKLEDSKQKVLPSW